MALRNRAALNLNANQENVKNAKSVALGTGQMRRAALGEIGNKVVVNRNKDLTGKSGILLKDKNKTEIKIGKVEKVSEKVNEKVTEKVTEKLTEKVYEKTTLKVTEKHVVDFNPSVRLADFLKSQSHENVPQQLITKEHEANAVIKEHDTQGTKKETDSFSSDLITIEDIDEEDRKNPILVSVYSNDIYNHLRNLELQFPIQKGYLQGQEVTPKMRSVLIDWLIEVHEQFHLMQETLYLTVAIIDRFLQGYKQVTRKRLQLVGVTAMFIASKYEEMYSPDISDFVYIADNAYTKAEILQMELRILRVLNFSFGRPLPLHFLRRYSKAGRALPVHHTLAKYFLEQCLVHYEVCHYPPSLIAAGAIYLAFILVGNENPSEGHNVVWTKTLTYYSTYTSQQVLPVVQDISAIMCNIEKSKFQAVRRKYTSSKHMRISLRPELKSPTLNSLANSRQE